MKKLCVILLILLVISMTTPLSFADDVTDENSDGNIQLETPETPAEPGVQDNIENQKTQVKQATLSISYEPSFLVQYYYIYGVIAEDVSDASKVVPYYSLDGLDYKLVSKYSSWEAGFDNMQKGLCMVPTDVPYKQYLDGEIDEFYIKLLITGGEYEGFTTACKISRGEAIPLPEIYSFHTIYQRQNLIFSGRESENVYKVTVKEGTTNQELLAMLPDSIRPEVQILELVYKEDYDIYVYELVGTTTSIDYSLSWKLDDGLDVSSLKADSTQYVGIATPSKPTDYVANALIAMINYSFSPPDFFDPLKLKITVVPKDYQPDITIGYLDDDDLQLYCSLLDKPEGASELTTQYFVQGGETWIDSNKTTSVTNVMLNQSENRLNIPCGLDNNQSPMKEYLSGEIEGFLVRVKIKGGAFDGYSKTVTWPEGATIIPPTTDAGGAGGNRGDTGSNTGNGSGDRFDPDIPLEPILPPDNTSPPETTKQEGTGINLETTSKGNLNKLNEVFKVNSTKLPDKLSGRQTTTIVELSPTEKVYAEDDKPDAVTNEENQSTVISRQNKNNWPGIPIIITVSTIGIITFIIRILKGINRKS